jgi:predicted nucleic-acid-binding protein
MAPTQERRMSTTFTALLESADVEFEHPPTVEEALYVWAQHPEADFADCLLYARAAHVGRSHFLTFDAGAARSPGAELLA